MNVPLSCAVLLALFGSAVQAATFTVTRSDDGWDGACDAHCTLRDTVQAANDTPGTDTVALRATTYRLTLLPPSADTEEGIGDEDDNRSDDLDVTDHLLIKGHPDGTYIDGGGITRLFEISPGIAAELRDLRLRRGKGLEVGGAIANYGDLKLVRSDLRLNLATSLLQGLGGAVYNEGYLSVADSHFQANTAAGGADGGSGHGGAIYSVGRLNVRTTRFVDNRGTDENDDGSGGAIFNRTGLATIERSYLAKNRTSSAGYGGAIANRDGGALRLSNSTVSANVSGVLALGQGSGAIASGAGRDGEAPTRLSLLYSTVAANEGGGLYTDGRTLILFSIVGGNFERAPGGALDDNAGSNCRNEGTIEQRGFLSGLDGNCPYQIGVLNEQIFSVVLYPLADHGGFAPTHALRAESDWAIDRVPTFEDCPDVDMRGLPRPVEGDGRDDLACDIGAFERQPIDH